MLLINGQLYYKTFCSAVLGTLFVCVYHHSLLIYNFIVINRKALTRAHLQGASFGLSEAFMFFANAAAFRYGGHLVEEEEMNMEQVFK